MTTQTLEPEQTQEQETPAFRGPISEHMAIRAYQRMHEYAAEVREINKRKKEDKAIVDEFLHNNPQGFTVHLRDARDNQHEYHIKHETKTRITLVKDALAAKIGIAVNELSPSAIAEAVRDGVVDINLVRALEDISEHTSIKKTKIKKPKKKDNVQ